MKTLRNLCTAFIVVSILTLTAHAADLAGNWKWTSVSKSGGSSEITAVLQVKDGIITGTVTGRQGPADISDGMIKDDTITFSVVRTVSTGIGSKTTGTVTFTYTGKLAGDTITGTLERPGKELGSVTKTDWKAMRSN